MKSTVLSISNVDGLFDSFGEETISYDDYVQTYDDVGKLSNKSDHYRGIICYQYSIYINI